MKCTKASSLVHSLMQLTQFNLRSVQDAEALMRRARAFMCKTNIYIYTYIYIYIYMYHTFA